MSSIINWIKSNKLSALLIFVLGYIFLKGTLETSLLLKNKYSRSYDELENVSLGGMPTPTFSERNIGIPPMPPEETTPRPDVGERMVAKTASQSLLVQNVREAVENIEKRVQGIGGYVVSKSLNTPEESSYGYITIRVPSEKLEETLEYFGTKSVKVVHESVTASDVTDQYEDTVSQLAVLEKTKSIFEGILNEASTFDEILRAQKEILGVQRQIDSVKGRIEYMKATTETSLISVSLSTDELALGYAPADSWRPTVVFKKAVRSLVATSRQVGNTGIWVSVYGCFGFRFWWGLCCLGSGKRTESRGRRD